MGEKQIRALENICKELKLRPTDYKKRISKAVTKKICTKDICGAQRHFTGFGYDKHEIKDESDERYNLVCFANNTKHDVIHLTNRLNAYYYYIVVKGDRNKLILKIREYIKQLEGAPQKVQYALTHGCEDTHYY